MHPKNQMYDDEWVRWVILPKGYIEITDYGRSFILNYEFNFELHEEVWQRVKPLMDIGYYDSAVREASILVNNLGADRSARGTAVPDPRMTMCMISS